jgi:GT2 family glycosyltransferase
MVSVVICAYNAERTMRACLESLRTIDYPNYEVVIVDDGSRDRTAEIAGDFSEFRLIRQPNKGLSAARNVGMRAARGELIAYTDSDCVVDPHWLTLMIRAMNDQGFDSCGGPNYAPHEEGWVEACCAASPGAPCHVLVGDDRAEHLAGCNMIYRKSALAAIGGFDPQFTAAGDDVDICWRMLAAGFTLGFCPAAFVWHFRRNTVNAYYGQQRGYGKAEAMLFLKYPERFNALGQISWHGTIPGLARTIPGGARHRIGWARRARDLQHVAEKPLSILKVLPLTAEWNAAAAVAVALSWVMGVTLAPSLAALALGPLWAVYYAANAPLEKCHRGFVARMLIAYLAFTGPIARTIARYRYRKSVSDQNVIDTPARQRPAIHWWRRSLRLAYWNEAWTTRDRLLERVGRIFAQAGRPVTPEAGWSDADLVIEPGALTQIEIKTADEEHSGNRMKNHVAIRARLHMMTRVGLVVGVAGAMAGTALGFEEIAIACVTAVAGIMICAASEVAAAMHLAYRVVEQAADELALTPLGRALPASAAIIPVVAPLQPSEARVSRSSVQR